jgi:predicted MFS family arabinose efflux permease
MNAIERRSVGLLSAMYALRMVGLFLIFPVFALYAQGLTDQTPALIGFALGTYGLTQAILQIPFGMASDRYGRKPVIALGLIVFAVGSAVAAVSTSIWGVVLGRSLQGAGAISAPVMALLADLTREEQRTKAMAVIGVTIGLSMIGSLILGPVVNNAIGVPGIFWMTGVAALLALAVMYFAVPDPVRLTKSDDSKGLAPFLRMLRDPQLGRLNAGIFVVHLVITAMFLVLPHILVEHVGLASAEHWKIYLLVMVGGIVVMVPALGFSNRTGQTAGVFVAAVALLVVSEILLAVEYRSPFWLIVLLIAFFAAFNLLEAMLPSLVSRLAPAKAKGAAIGIFGTAQFLGAFTGGAVGGLVYQYAGASGVFMFAALAAAVWLVLAFTAPPFQLLSTRTVHIGKQSAADAKRLAHELLAVPGVAEAVVVADEGVVYLKVDAATLDERVLGRCLGG